MSTRSSTGSSAGRRLRQGFLAASLILATTVSAVLGTMIAQRKSVRFDVTQTRMHHLADRTRAIFAGLDGPYEIVLAFNTRATNEFGQLRVDLRARQRTDDVLQEMLRVRPDLVVTSIDTGSIEGTAAYESLLGRLIERERDAIDDHAQTVETAAADLGRIGTLMSGTLATRLDQLAKTVEAVDQPTQANRAVMEDRAKALARVGQEMVQVADQAAQLLTPPAAAGGVWLPESDAVAALLPTQLKTAAANLDVLSRELTQLANGETGLSAATRTGARELANQLAALGDEMLVQADVVQRLTPADLHRIRTAITTGEVVLVIGPPEKGVTAIEFDALFPSTDVIDQTSGLQADLRRRAEEMLASALGSLSSEARPIVVIAHAEPMRGLENPALFGTAARRLELRGMDVLEWPISIEPTIPNIGAIDPDGNRPVVWIFHDTESWASVSQERLPGPTKAANLGRAMQAVLDRGDAMLISSNPSMLPAYGQADPTVAVLGAFGLEAASGRALLREVATGTRRGITPDFRVQIEEAEHPITSAVSGLPMWMSWPVSIGAGEPVEGARWWPLVVIEAGVGERVWGESEWLGMRRIAASQRQRMASPPQFDEGRDDESGRWTVAAAAERPLPASSGNKAGTQRLVYVGTNGWFLRDVLVARQDVDGRVVPIYPANAELLEAAVYWLSGQDRLIGKSATAQASPIIKALGAGQLRVINLMLIVVLPVMVLVTGVVWRVVRG
jgi:hypothetical protein